jgi:branched-chain amino acid transport system permease protein
MHNLVDILVSGSIYAVYALGFTLVFGVFGILNLSHSAVFGFTAVLVIYLVNQLSMPLLWAGLLGVLGGGVIGLLIERVAFRPIRYRSATAWSRHMGPMITSLGVASILVGVSNAWFGPDTRSLPQSVLADYVTIAGVRITAVDALGFIVMVALFAGLSLALQRSRWGVEVRAVADQPGSAMFVGINSEARTMQVFTIAGLLGGVAGLLWTLHYTTASSATGSQLDLRGFAIIVLGGMGSIRGAVVGAFFVAAAEVLSVAWLPGGWQDIVVYVALFLMLVLRPQGILGRRLEADRA